jgi:hypothetical protein
MSSNSNRVTGGVMLLLGVVASVVASAWPTGGDYRDAIWGFAAALMGFGIVLGLIGMMQDILGGIDDLKKHLQTVSDKVDELQKEVAALERRP